MVQRLERELAQLEELGYGKGVTPIRQAVWNAFAQDLIPNSIEGPREEIFTNPFTFYPKRRLVIVDGRDIIFSRIDVEILRVLFRNVGRFVGYDEFARYVWNTDDVSVIQKKRLKVHIRTIRNVIEPGLKNGRRSRYISTQIGDGYQLLPLEPHIQAQE